MLLATRTYLCNQTSSLYRMSFNIISPRMDSSYHTDFSYHKGVSYRKGFLDRTDLPAHPLPLHETGHRLPEPSSLPNSMPAVCPSLDSSCKNLSSGQG